MRHILLLGPLLLLAACQTPFEACVAAASRDLRVVEGLIRETQGNLARGYAIERDERVRVDRDLCRVEVEDGPDGFVRCDDVDVVRVNRPVAIDPIAERRELDGLLERREALLAEREARLGACRAAYPAG